MSSPSEEFKKRLQDKPDAYTLAWWSEQFQEVHKGYRGATHAINRALADNEDLGKSLRESHELIHKLYGQAEADRAKIGELQAKLLKAEERLDRQGEFLTTLKQKNGSKA